MQLSCAAGIPGCGGRSEHADTVRSRKSRGAIPRREFVPRDRRPWNYHRGCMPRWQAFESRTTRGVSVRALAGARFPGVRSRTPQAGMPAAEIQAVSDQKMTLGGPRSPV